VPWRALSQGSPLPLMDRALALDYPYYGQATSSLENYPLSGLCLYDGMTKQNSARQRLCANADPGQLVDHRMRMSLRMRSSWCWRNARRCAQTFTLAGRSQGTLQDRAESQVSTSSASEVWHLRKAMLHSRYSHPLPEKTQEGGTCRRG
jgi:hypothetical protein